MILLYSVKTRMLLLRANQKKGLCLSDCLKSDSRVIILSKHPTKNNLGLNLISIKWIFVNHSLRTYW